MMSEEELRKIYSTHERIIEIPWVLRRVPKGSLVLDVGCTEGVYHKALKEKQCIVHGIDLRPLVGQQEKHIDVFIQGDILNHPKLETDYDVITCISTLEHAGLRAYSNERIDPYADLKMLLVMSSLLRKSGLLFITVPFGRLQIDFWLRSYSDTYWRHFIDMTGLDTVEESFFKFNKTGRSWSSCKKEDLKDVGLEVGFLGHASGIICGEYQRLGGCK